MPNFNLNLSTTPVLTTSVTVYTGMDLYTGLQGIQDHIRNTNITEPLIRLTLWQNVSLAGVADLWPAGGFRIPTNLSITGVNPSWLNPQYVSRARRVPCLPAKGCGAAGPARASAPAGQRRVSRATAPLTRASGRTGARPPKPS